MWFLALGMVLAAGFRPARAQTAPMGMPMSMPMPASGAAAAPGATTLPAVTDVEVKLSTDVEDGKKQLVATVKRAGKPVEGATVSFGARRSFGRLGLGTDVTLDDGTAAIAFPTDLPGDDKGNLELSAMVQGPLSQWGASAQTLLPGGKPKPPPMDNFPRALWSPYAPVGLIVAIAVLVGGAWGAYLFVAYQLLVIRKGAST
jgi:hypothetical protein